MRIASYYVFIGVFFSCMMFITYRYTSMIYIEPPWCSTAQHCGSGELLQCAPTKDTKYFKIITGASANHYHVLKKFIGSLLLEAINHPIIVYDLGLDKEQKEEVQAIAKWHTHVQYRAFDFAKYPSYFDICKSKGEYAWKPVIIKTVLDEHDTSGVIWMDAGNLMTSSIEPLVSLVEKYGVFSTNSSETVQRWTHPLMLTYFNLTPYWEHIRSPNYNGAMVGFMKNSWAYTKVVQPWAKCAMTKACIAPPGSSRVDHRQDQAALTILLYLACNFSCPTIELLPIRPFSIHNDREELDAKFPCHLPLT